MSCGYGPYVDLMKRYPLVTDAFLRLKEPYQKVPIMLACMHAYISSLRAPIPVRTCRLRQGYSCD